MEQLTIHAHAKINLTLDVLNRRPDGYHTVRMIMQSLSLCDTLFLQKTTEPGIVLSSRNPELFPDVTWDENNLIYKAAKLMFTEYNIKEGVCIHLTKNIPIAAGMAGGSTDAAATMKGINELFGLQVPLEHLMELGVRIGADVPYCILGGTALAEGIGEKLTKLSPIPHCHILVAKPDINVSTKFVYEHLDAEGVKHHPDIDGMVNAIKKEQLDGILERMENVLETVTIPAHPVIAIIKEKMLEFGADNSLMSGSGPTVFGIYTDETKAKTAYQQMKDAGLAKQVFLTSPVSD